MHTSGGNRVMSAFYVGMESISMLTDIIVRYNCSGYNAFGFDLPKGLLNCFGSDLSENSIFAALAGMNISALKERYGENANEMWDEKGYEDGHDIWEPRTGRVEQWHYQLLKSLDCYIYQCSEGSIPDMELYKQMERFDAILAGWIARNQLQYENAEWR